MKKAKQQDVVDFPTDMLVNNVGPFVSIMNVIMLIFWHWISLHLFYICFSPEIFKNNFLTDNFEFISAKRFRQSVHRELGKVDRSARLIRSFSRVFSIPARIARSRAPSIKFHMLFLNSSFTKWSSKILSKIKKKPYFNLLKFISGFYWTIKNDICKTSIICFPKRNFLNKIL